MTKNVSNNLMRISNCCLILLLCTLTIISFIDVVPERQSTFEKVFYVCAIVFVISLSISLREVIMRFFRKRAVKRQGHRNEYIDCKGEKRCVTP